MAALSSEDRRIKWVDQVHSNTTLRIGRSDECGQPADAMVSKDSLALTIFVADCAPIALGTQSATMGALHCGWKGLRDGIIRSAHQTIRDIDHSQIFALIGPCIGPCCYEFSYDDLADIALKLRCDPEEIAAFTQSGSLALDLRKAIGVELASLDIELSFEDKRCTSCVAGEFFSYRARGEAERMALIVEKL